jgi:3-oxoacyl-[acyl-carrier protein] reductase
MSTTKTAVFTSCWDPAIRIVSAELARQGARILSTDDAGLASCGPIDLLVIGPQPQKNGGSVCSPDTTADEVRQAIKSWLTSVDLAAQRVSPDRRCRIVTVVSSIGRYRSGYFQPEQRRGSYAMDAACNSALLGLMRQRALELAPHIALNAVATGWIGPPDISPTGEALTDMEGRFLVEEVALRRPGTPEEVSAVILFLASAASSYLTGEVIDVNGGWWMS